MVNNAPPAAIDIAATANTAAGGDSSGPKTMSHVSNNANTHARLTTRNKTVRNFEFFHGARFGSVNTDLPAACTFATCAINRCFDSARKTVYPIAMAAKSQTGFAGLAKSDRAMSIMTQANVNATVLTLRPGTTVPNGNKTAPTTPNARADERTGTSSSTVTARIVAGNRHRPSPINTAPCTPWLCKRTAYIGPYRADNVTSHNETSISDKSKTGGSSVTASDPLLARPTMCRIGIIVAERMTKIAATMCQRVILAPGWSDPGRTRSACHGSLRAVSAYAKTPKGRNRMINNADSASNNRYIRMLMLAYPRRNR